MGDRSGLLERFVFISMHQAVEALLAPWSSNVWR